MPPSPPPPPGPLEKPSKSSSGFFGRPGKWGPRSALGILVFAGIAYSVLIDNPFRPGQESVLREGVKEFAYWRDDGATAQQTKARTDLVETQAKLNQAQASLAQAERERVLSEAATGPAPDLGAAFFGTPSKQELPSTTDSNSKPDETQEPSR